MNEIEQRAREVFAQWHADQGCGSKIIEDCKSGVISMDPLTRELLHMALTPPEGYVLVTVEPTEEMLKVGYSWMMGRIVMRSLYDELLAARPEAP